MELVDSGLDDLASENLLGVLLGRVETIIKLDLARNRMGVKGATALARYIAHKGWRFDSGSGVLGAILATKRDGIKTQEPCVVGRPRS